MTAMTRKEQDEAALFAVARLWRAIWPMWADEPWEGFAEEAERVGLVEHVIYDPRIHGDEIDAEPGEAFIYVLSAIGKRAWGLGQ